MEHHNRSEVSRRSSRVPIAVPLLVTSMDPGNDFSEVCETLVVSAHGCALRSPMKVKAGVPVHLHTKEGREMMARIIDCQPIGSTPQAWKLGAQLDEPANLWGLNPCPEDWNGRRAHGVAKESRPAPAPPEQGAESPLSSDRLQRMIAPLLQPLQAEVAALAQKLARREANPSRFEVSLSQIPPQLEQELWARLRQDLGQRALELTREEAQRILDSAQAAIEAKINQSQDELRQHVGDQLSGVAERAREVADEAAENVQHHFRAGLERLQQHLVEAEARLAQQGAALAKALHRQLEEEHEAQRRDLERLRETVSAEWSQIEARLGEVDSRLAKLDDSAQRLESEFDTHISGMASELVSRTKVQLENVADAVLRSLRTRNAQELEMRLEEAFARLNTKRSEVEALTSESLQTRLSENTQSFEQTLNAVAQQYVESWRRALANQLSSFVSLLGQKLRVDLTSGDPRTAE